MRFGLDDGYSHTLEEVWICIESDERENKTDRSKGYKKIKSHFKKEKT